MDRRDRTQLAEEALRCREGSLRAGESPTNEIILIEEAGYVNDRLRRNWNAVRAFGAPSDILDTQSGEVDTELHFFRASEKRHFMDAAMAVLTAQLEIWSHRIDRLARSNEMAKGAASFDALIYVDELKGLRAIAQSKLDACRACAVEMKVAMADIDAALGDRHPRPKV